jgi:hypothetical protein
MYAISILLSSLSADVTTIFLSARLYFPAGANRVFDELDFFFRGACEILRKRSESENHFFKVQVTRMIRTPEIKEANHAPVLQRVHNIRAI